MADAVGPVFFDRGVVDALGMVNQIRPLSAAELQARLTSYPYFRTAFCFPPWEEIYRTDAERDHTFAHAVAVHRDKSLLGIRGAATIWSRCRAQPSKSGATSYCSAQIELAGFVRPTPEVTVRRKLRPKAARIHRRLQRVPGRPTADLCRTARLSGKRR